jgi:hypothetical protein
MAISPYCPEFPFYAFPGLLGDAMHEAMQMTQAPDALVISSTLAVASLAVQNLVDMERRENLVGPTSLLFWSLGGSGERKSTVDSLLTKAIREFDSLRDNEHEKAMTEYEGEFAVWQILRHTAVSELRRAHKTKDDSLVLRASESLANIVKNVPQPPQHSPLLFNDATPAALKDALRIPKSSIGIFASEGASVSQSKTINDFALINELWDGGTRNIDRAGSGRWRIEDCRLTTSLMVQPEIFEKFVESRGEEARSIGFFARTLIAYPLSTQGFRLRISPVRNEHLPKFHQRVSELLNQSRENQQKDNPARTKLKFDWRAQGFWNEIQNRTEISVQPFGRLTNFKDYASKYADNLARIAAVIHCFEGRSGDINLETLEQAKLIADWYLENFLHLFSPPPQLDNISYKDAFLLRDWLAEEYALKGVTQYLRRQLAQFGPLSIRKINLLCPALAVLVEWQAISISGRKRNPLVLLNQAYFNQFLSSSPRIVSMFDLPNGSAT